MSNPVKYSLEEGVATLVLDDGKANEKTGTDLFIG